MSTFPYPKPLDPATWASASWPLGATYDPATSTATFAVAAPAATRVLLEFYPTATGSDALADADLARGPDGVWRARMSGVGPGALYGYRVWGPGWQPDPGWQRGGSTAGFASDVADGGLRFNPNKVLTDPYAREISHSTASRLVTAQGVDAGIFGTGGADYHGRPRREHDTGKVAPKAVVVHDTTTTGARPGIPAENTSVYEAHVRGLTNHPSASSLSRHVSGIPAFAGVSDIPEALRGTYAGAALLAPYLKALGFTTIELLPVHETVGSEPDSTSPNYWGYATVGFFAPNRMYAADQSPGGPTREFKEMVAAFHAAGIEVYLDVVYNHTGEGGLWGGALDTAGLTGLIGFSAPDYYALTSAGGLVDGATGCSNQTDASSPLFQKLVLDSLAHWVDEMGVDGFRFDLAPVLGRLPDAHARDDWAAQRGFTREHPLLTGIRDLATARDIEVIAEAWDLWGYEVGNFPPGWAEWNGHYRDAVRRFLKGDANTGSFLDVVNGDYRAFADQGGPQRSINFVTAHDGFTLMDLVSYSAKNNLCGPPFGPSDGGSDSNDSWDSGGDQGLRRQRVRNFWVMLFLSRGVPMVVSGDEYGRTQNGNNNPYNVDTVGIWNNWAMAAANAPTAVPVDTSAAGGSSESARYQDVFGTAGSPAGVNPLLVFAAYLTRLRRDHPGLRQRSYGDAAEGGDDVSYIFTAPDGLDSPAAGDRAVRLLIDASGIGACDLLVLVNMASSPVDFVVPQAGSGMAWRRLIDTAGIFEPGFNCWAQDAGDVIVGHYGAAAWTVVVLGELPAPTGATPSGPAGPSTPSTSASSTTAVVTQVAEAVGDAVRSWWRSRH